MPDVLTPEDVILHANLLPPRPPVDVFEQLGTVDRLAVQQAAGARAELRQAVVRIPGLAHRFVDDERCGTCWTVLGYITHTAQVQHEAGDVTPQPVEVDERDLGRQGESRTAVRS
jgi:hypothetical protein